MKNLTIEIIYAKALELINKKIGGTQHREEFEGFEFVLVTSNQDGDCGAYSGGSYVKVMKKDIGFTFKVRKNDPKDLYRMQYVYDVTVACNNNNLLLPLAKKVTPKFEKIDKKYPRKITRNEYKQMDIHSKEAVIYVIEKILS